MSDGSTGQGDATSSIKADDDIVIAFRTEKSSAMGRIVRLGASVDQVLSSHAYPEPVSRVLGEALALTAMLGSQLKFDGKLILQTNSDGPLRVLVVNYWTETGAFRGYASFDADAIASLATRGPSIVDDQALLGKGYLALTIDQGPDMERYQGIVELDGSSLSGAAQEYFRRSEQIASYIKLSVAKIYSGGSWRWRAGGLLIQHLTAEGGVEAPLKDDGSDSGLAAAPEEEDWRRVETLARTVEDHELTDPTLSPQLLLYRLFHEEGVRAAPGKTVVARCGCTREHVRSFLERFGPAELADLTDPDGGVTVTCEFCSTPYRFTDAELAVASASSEPPTTT